MTMSNISTSGGLTLNSWISHVRLKIVTINFTMYVSTNLACPLKYKLLDLDF